MTVRTSCHGRIYDACISYLRLLRFTRDGTKSYHMIYDTTLYVSYEARTYFRGVKQPKQKGGHEEYGIRNTIRNAINSDVNTTTLLPYSFFFFFFLPYSVPEIYVAYAY